MTTPKDTLKLPVKETKTGKIKTLGDDMSYGFINADDDSSATFVHLNHLQEAGISRFIDGQQVSYQVQLGENGRVHAANIKVID